MLRNVIKYSFSPKSLRREIRSDDFWKYSLAPNRIESIITDYSNKFAECNYEVDNISIIKRETGKNLFIIQDLRNNLLIRRTNTILRRFVNHADFDRNEEIKQLSSIISSEPNAIIFRCDITSFFESIIFENVLKKICNDGYNNLPSLKVLQSISTFANNNGQSGLPRGLSISSTLANYFLKDFDKSINLIDSCFYYSRYVDDIIIIYTKKNIDVEDIVKEKLKKIGLVLNTKKTHKCIIGNVGKLEYLGYSLDLQNGEMISISNKKIKKTKTRISLSVISFNMDFNFALLYKRLLFLTANTKMKMSGREKSVIVGFKYSYSLCQNELLLEQMKLLDKYYYNIINSKKYKPSIIMRNNITTEQLKKLNKLSFKNGYLFTIKNKLSRNEISEIKKAWKYA